MTHAPESRPLDLDTPVRATDEQVSSDLGDEVVILDLSSGRYISLDGVGALVWNTIQETVPVSRVRDRVLEEFEVERDRCTSDVLELLEELRARGLVRTEEGTSPSGGDPEP